MTMNKQDLLFFANEFPNRNVIIKWHRDGTSTLPWLNEGRDIVAAHSAIEYIEATEKSFALYAHEVFPE